jgi:hypothetical protein
MLPLVLPQAHHSGESGSIIFATKASADGTFNRLMRWTGYGWSCGYHACNNQGWGLRDALPPVGNTAHQNTMQGPGKFELVDPARPVRHMGGHANYGHHHMPVMHYNQIETLPTNPMPVGSIPLGEIGPSLVVPEATPASPTFQPYRSAVPPKSPSKPAVKSEDSKTASPSDLELLPSPKGESDDLDDLLLEEQSFRVAPQRNRSARMPGALKPR